jgi:hypothetical protein
MSEPITPYRAHHAFGPVNARGVAPVYRASPTPAEVAELATWLDYLSHVALAEDPAPVTDPAAAMDGLYHGALAGDRLPAPNPTPAHAELVRASRDLIAVGEAILDQLYADLYGKSAALLLLPHVAAWDRASATLRRALATAEARP